MEESDVLKLEKATRQRGVCLLVARSYGLVGYLRVSCGSCPDTPLTRV